MPEIVKGEPIHLFKGFRMEDILKEVELNLVVDGFSREEAKHIIELTMNPELCKKETGYTPHEHYLIRRGFTPEQARYIEENPCIDGSRDECDYFRKEGNCYGCTDTNGFIYWKIGDDKLVPTETFDELKKKSIFL